MGKRGPKPKPVSDRFWPNVKKTKTCWLWTGSLDKRGYGQISISPNVAKAHRVSYELHYGKIPNGLFVCHTCDIRECVNPRHLWLGTNRDNIDDKQRKQRTPKGSASPRAKLNEQQVLEIRKLHNENVFNKAELALRYGVTWSTINLIIRRVNWAHL